MTSSCLSQILITNFAAISKNCQTEHFNSINKPQNYGKSDYLGVNFWGIAKLEPPQLNRRGLYGIKLDLILSIENSMEKPPTKRLSRQDWIRDGLQFLQERGVAGIKIVALAESLGVTSGSFYWHFKGLSSLLDSLLEYWETELTDAIIVEARAFSGPPAQRILGLMLQVIENDAAALDHAIMVWARNDPAAQAAFERTLQKRFKFSHWMFKQAGFSDRQAVIRGRLMVTYLMGESSTNLKSNAKWKGVVREEFDVLMNPIR